MKKRLDLTCFISYISYNMNLVRAGAVAQLGEHHTCTVGVAGSNPVSSTIFCMELVTDYV